MIWGIHIICSSVMELPDECFIGPTWHSVYEALEDLKTVDPEKARGFTG